MSRSLIFLLVLSVVVSVFIVVSSYSWFMVWVGLEMNTLSILPILCYQFTPRSVESTIKYFLIQAFSAAIILNVVLIQVWLFSSWSVSQPLNGFSSLVLVLAVGLKLGLFPCHFWFPDVLQGLGFIQGLVLSTWQKIAPYVVLVYASDSINEYFLVFLSVISVLVGGWGGLNQVQVRKILAFSSISHIGWICGVVVYSVSVSCVMLGIYLFLNSVVFLLSSELGLLNLSSLSRMVYYNSGTGLLLMLVVLSLGGLPPLTGFINKFLALECLVLNNLIVPSCILVMGSLLSLFFYLRIGFNSSLCLFPQHSLVLFSWRSSLMFSSSITVYSIILSILLCISVFGLILFPLFWSMG
uniref:NADH dehydrogenase subunit 2 n=1 Tax=Zoroaster ophiactis TaxID=467010 RepID=UPI0020287D1A|nr:NADH dehydrogenase subunit 2 [Zoroaster ophiactis]UPP55903.1 NADH dehydrogenase subunit 2 [Zoroaster ophiactis]